MEPEVEIDERMESGSFAATIGNMSSSCRLFQSGLCVMPRERGESSRIVQEVVEGIFRFHLARNL